MVKGKKILFLSMITAALLVSIAHTSPDGGSYYISSPLMVSSFRETTGMSLGTFTTGILIEYAIFLIATYLLLRGISKKFEG